MWVDVNLPTRDVFIDILYFSGNFSILLKLKSLMTAIKNRIHKLPCYLTVATQSTKNITL